MIYFFKEDGTEKFDTIWTGPGRSHWGPVRTIGNVEAGEGELVTFHTGHGVFEEYRVVAKDKRDCFVQRTNRPREIR